MPADIAAERNSHIRYRETKKRCDFPITLQISHRLLSLFSKGRYWEKSPQASKHESPPSGGWGRLQHPPA